MSRFPAPLARSARVAAALLLAACADDVHPTAPTAAVDLTAADARLLTAADSLELAVLLADAEGRLAPALDAPARTVVRQALGAVGAALARRDRATLARAIRAVDDALAAGGAASAADRDALRLTVDHMATVLRASR